MLAHQGILGSRHDRNVSSPDDLEHAQRVRDFFFQPRIASHNGDAENLSLRGLDQQQDGLLIGSSRPGRVLIDDDLALSGRLLAPGWKTRREQYRDHDPQPEQSHFILPNPS